MGKTTPRTVRRSFLGVLALSAIAPLLAGCEGVLYNAAPLWGAAYAYELLLTPARMLIGTALLEFINTF